VIGTLGVVPRGYLLVIAKDEETDQRLHLQTSTDAIAREEQVLQREFAINALVNRRAARRRELSGNGGASQQDSSGVLKLNSLLGLFANCTLCADCLDACPLYDGELEGMLGVNRAHQGGRPLLSELVGVSRWLVSCSGCGMCQEACEHSVTLAPLISMISHRLRSELNYTAGDPFQQLPWEAA
jgi:ferredoxin